MSNLNCPPRKKRSGAMDSSSQPQISLSRSTPIREFSPMDDTLPNISSIGSCSSNSSSHQNDNINRKKKQLVVVQNQTSLLQINELHSEDNSSDLEDPSINITKIKQLKNKGHNWRFIKPTNKNSLYFEILLKDYNIENLALKWCNDYVENNEKAIIELQQLFIDLTGVRNFNLNDLLKSNKRIEKVFEILEDTISKTDLDKFYLCNSAHQYSIKCLQEIYKFLRLVWIISSDRKFLYEPDLCLKVMKPIHLMITNTVKVMHHTGIFLAIKLLTVFGEVHKKIAKEPLDKEEQEAYLSYLLKNEDYLLCLLHKYCCNAIDSPRRAKMQYLEEIVRWFKLIPTVMFKEKYFNSLLILAEDCEHAKIRQKAITICKDLVAFPKSFPHITSVFAKLVKTIEKRIKDVDYDVSIAAVEFLSLLLDNYRCITFQQEANVGLLMFQKNYPLARAAGEFVIKCFRNNSENNENVGVIVNLIQFALIPNTKFKEYIELLVESVIDFAKELQNYDLIFTMLMRGENTEEEEIILCQILSQTVVQTVTGRSPIPRVRSRQEKPQELVNQKIAYFFITRLYDLIRKFSRNVVCLKCFCEILLVFDYEEIPLTHYYKYLDQLMSLQECLFINTVNEDVLDSLSKLYSMWMSEFCPLKLRASAAFDVIFEKTVNVYKSNLEEFFEGKEELIKSDLETDLLHLEVLFRYNDLRRIDWNSLFIHWDLNDDFFTVQSVERNMKCCYWFLLWEARSLKNLNVDTDLVQQKVDQLELKCTSFTVQCLSVMSQNQEKPTLLQTAFDVIIDLHLELLHELSVKFSEVPQFKQLILKVSTIQAQNVLVDYVLTRAFTTDEKETLKMRRSNVAKLMNAFIEEIIPFEKHIGKIFKFYNEYYDIYGDLFDTTLNMFQKIGGVVVICAVIVLAIRYSYMEYLSLKGNFDSTSAEIEQINALGRHLLQYLKRKMDEDSILAVLKHAVSYASAVREHRHFLYFFFSFVPALNINQHKELFNYLIEYMSADEDVPETFVNLAKKLNYKKGKGLSLLSKTSK